MARKKKEFPVDENGERIPPEKRWALVDGPWDQPEIHSRWKDFDLFMEQYGSAVEESNGKYTFSLIRKGLNDPTKDPEGHTLRPIQSKIQHKFDQEWIEKHEMGGGGKYAIRLIGPVVDVLTGKEKPGGQQYVCEFYNLIVPGDPNNLPRKKRRSDPVEEDYEDEARASSSGSWNDVAKQLTRSNERAREEASELARDMLDRALSGQDNKREDSSALVEMARSLSEQKQHGVDANMQMMMKMMEIQAMSAKTPPPLPLPDNSKELDRLMQMIDRNKSDHRDALGEERDRARTIQDQLRQQFMDQMAALKEDRERRERELKDDLAKVNAELRDCQFKLDDTKSKLSTTQLEKVSAEVKATLGGNGDKAGGLAGFKKTLSDVKAITQLVNPEGSGGSDEGGDWKSKLLDAATDPRVAAAAGSVLQTAVGAIRRPQLGGMPFSPQLPAPQIQQMPDPSQQAWMQQQAQLEAQRQAAQLGQGVEQVTQVEQEASENPTPTPAGAAAVEGEEEKTFEDVIEGAAAEGVGEEAFLREILKQYELTIQEAKDQMAGQSLDQVVANLGVDMSKLTVAGQSYVKDLYQFLQMTG